MYGEISYQAFIDETGNFGFDFSKIGTSTHFIVTSIIIHPQKIDLINQKLDQIRKNYFSGGEIKSSSIGSDYVRRINILKEIKDLDFLVLSYIIDKRKIKRDSGLSFKKSFFKYCNSLLHDELRNHYKDLDIFSDQHGNKDFMQEFKAHFYKRQTSFLNTYQFSFVDSKENNCVQLADFIGGTIALKYKKNIVEKYSVFLNFIEDKILEVLNFPIDYSNYMEEKIVKTDKYNEMIARHCINTSLKYIKNNRNSENIEEEDRILILNYLLFKLQTSNPNGYVYSSDLIKHIKKINKRSYTKHQFSSKLIAKLRDSGVVLSSSNKGYKIPINLEEVNSYTNQTMQIVDPMLARLRKCRKIIKSATDNQIDILESDQYRPIMDYFDYIKGDKI